MTLFGFFRIVHIVAGFSALSSFWIPMATKKGSRLHRRAGWFYVYAMATVAATAVTLGVIRLFFQDGNSDSRKTFAAFLIFIAILSASSAWFGVRVLRQKKRQGVHSHYGDLAWSGLLAVASVTTIIAGARLGQPLLEYFPLIGLFLAANQLVYWLRAPTEKAHWWLKHMTGMFASCIATVTAFTVFGGPRFLNIPNGALLLWFLPTMILVPILIVWSRYYRRKFAAKLVAVPARDDV